MDYTDANKRHASGTVRQVEESDIWCRGASWLMGLSLALRRGDNQLAVLNLNLKP